MEESDISGTIVIGEGERDKAPMLYVGEKLGNRRETPRRSTSPSTRWRARTSSQPARRTRPPSSPPPSPAGCCTRPTRTCDKFVSGRSAAGKVNIDDPVARTSRRSPTPSTATCATSPSSSSTGRATRRSSPRSARPARGSSSSPTATSPPASRAAVRGPDPRRDGDRRRAGGRARPPPPCAALAAGSRAASPGAPTRRRRSAGDGRRRRRRGARLLHRATWPPATTSSSAPPASPTASCCAASASSAAARGPIAGHVLPAQDRPVPRHGSHVGPPQPAEGAGSSLVSGFVQPSDTGSAQSAPPTRRTSWSATVASRSATVTSRRTWRSRATAGGPDPAPPAARARAALVEPGMRDDERQLHVLHAPAVQRQDVEVQGPRPEARPLRIAASACSIRLARRGAARR